MPIPWAIAETVVKAAAAAYQLYADAANDAQELEKLRDEIVAAITQMRNEVISEVISLRLAELEGQVAGFENTYDAYDPDPNSEAEEGRLVYIIDEGMSVLEELGVLIDMVRAEPALGLPAWPPYVSLLYLRAQAMTERELTYGADEIKDILPSVEDALHRMQGIETYLRDMSDARFGPVVSRRHADFTANVVGYMFGYYFVPCGYASDPYVFEKANEARDLHMDSAFASYEGVSAAKQAIADLQTTINDLAQTSFLDRLAELSPAIHKRVMRLDDGRIAFRGGLPASFRARHREVRPREAA